MKYLAIIIMSGIMLMGCKEKAVASENPMPFCHELKDGDKVIVPISETAIAKGVIVYSDRNPDPCTRLYLMLLEDYFARPFFVHYDEVLPYTGK